MKTAYLLKSLLGTRKSFTIIIVICFIFTSVLMNLSVASSENYFRERAFLEENRYDENYAFLTITSLSPLTRERINEILSEADLETCYMKNCTSGYIPKETAIDMSVTELQTGDMFSFQDMLSSYNLCAYDKAFDEEFGIGIIGEKPDKNKKYDGYVPVIAGANSSLSIGDEIKSNYFGKQTVFKVTAKYKDNILEKYFYAVDNNVYTDIEIMYETGLTDRPETLPTYELVTNPEEIQPVHIVNLIIKKPQSISIGELNGRISYIINGGDKTLLDAESYRAFNINSRIPYNVEWLDSDNHLTVVSLPMFIFIFIVSVIGITGNLVINNDKRKQNLLIFTICGAKKFKLCLLIGLCEAVITLPSLIASLLIGLLVKSAFDIQAISILSAMISSSVILTVSLILTLTQLLPVLMRRRNIL